jgi:hypothetical protein
VTTPLFSFSDPVAVAVAPNQAVAVNLTDAAPLWVVTAPAHATGKLELVLLDGSGAEIGRQPLIATSCSPAGTSCDLSALDPDAIVRIELRSDDLCVLPPIQVSLNALRGHAVAQTLPSDQPFAATSIAREPTA